MALIPRVAERKNLKIELDLFSALTDPQQTPRMKLLKLRTILQSVAIDKPCNLDSSIAVCRCNKADRISFIRVEVDDATKARKLVQNQVIIRKIDIVLVSNYR
jgi:hypothetical protein